MWELCNGDHCYFELSYLVRQVYTLIYYFSNLISSSNYSATINNNYNATLILVLLEVDL